MMTVMLRYLDLEEYQEATSLNLIPRPERCVACGHGKVWFVGWYERWVNLQSQGEERIRERIKVRRCRCARCKKGWSLLPGFCHPHRQYGMETVEHVLKKTCVERTHRIEDVRGPKGLGPSSRTVRRWMRWVPGLVRERLLDRLNRSYLPASRQTVAAAMGYVQEWHSGADAGDRIPLRAFAHMVVEAPCRGILTDISEYTTDARR